MSWATFLGQVRTLLLVGFITILVWLMAEAESLRTEKIRPEIRFGINTDVARLVRVEPGQDFTGTVTVTIEGPTAAVDALASRVRTSIDLEPGMPGIPSEAGRHTINLADALASHPLFRGSGVTITSVDPPSATIWEDDIVQRTVPVHVEMPEGTLLDGPAVSGHPTVTVRLPDSISKTLPDLVAIARVSPDAIANLPDGRRVAVGAPLSLPPGVQGDAAHIVPPQVMVEFTLRSSAATAVVQNVPVLIRVAPTEIGVWDVDLAPDQRVLTEVTVSGPAEMVDPIRTDKVKIVGYVALSFEDLDRAASSGKPIEKEVSFCDVPTLLRFEAKPRTVQVSVRRPEGPPAPRQRVTN